MLELLGSGAHVVMFSGGVGSWASAKRVAERHGTDHLVLLFADTLVEDADTYRFMHEGAANVGGELVIVKDGRTPFEVFRGDRFLGNSRLANCSKYLKQKPCRKWLEANCDPATTMLYVGIDWTETHRIPAIEDGWKPYRTAFPMAAKPYLDKPEMFEALRMEGIDPPADYGAGLPHANCGAQGCVRGGQAYWRTLLRETGRVAKPSPLTLRDFRERIEAQPALFDASEWGACGCFVDDGEVGPQSVVALDPSSVGNQGFVW